MSSNSRSRRGTEPRSGGKIVRIRRAPASKTPYDRPRFPNPVSQSPDWLSRYIISPTRTIASGAGKLLSFALSSPSSSSSSSLNYEDEIDSNGEDNKASLYEEDKVIKEPQSTIANGKTKRAIEELLMQETFSREECDKLTSIIRSRVIDCPTSEIANDMAPKMKTPDLYSTAVMEAKKWLKEKQSALDSNSDLGRGSCTLSPILVPKASEDEPGSPADIAKSYMQARPPWASPSLNHIRSPTSIGIKLFKEDIKNSIGGNSTIPSKLKRDFAAMGSWSIEDEIRKVRSRATEEMLKTRATTNIDFSPISAEYKNSGKSLAAEKLEASAIDSSHTKNSVDESFELTIGLSSSPVLGMRQGVLQNKVLPSDSVIISSEKDQGFGDQIIDDICTERTGSIQRPGLEHVKNAPQSPGYIDVTDNANGSNCLLNTIEGKMVEDSTLHERNCTISKEMTGEGVIANGFHSSGSSLHAGKITGENSSPCTDMIAKGNPEEEVCELLSEASMEVPDTNLNVSDSVALGSQNSSSMQYEGLEQDQSQSNSEPSSAAKTNKIVSEKPEGKRITRYNRRVRGRGK